MFHLMFVHYTFSSVWLLCGRLLGVWLTARLAVCSRCVLCSVVVFVCFPFIFCLFIYLFFFFGGGAVFTFDCSSSCSLLFYIF